MSRIPAPLMISTADRLALISGNLGAPRPRSDSFAWTVHDPETHGDARGQCDGCTAPIASGDWGDNHTRAWFEPDGKHWLCPYCHPFLQGLEAADQA